MLNTIWLTIKSIFVVMGIMAAVAIAYFTVMVGTVVLVGLALFFCVYLFLHELAECNKEEKDKES